MGKKFKMIYHYLILDKRGANIFLHLYIDRGFVGNLTLTKDEFNNLKDKLDMKEIIKDVQSTKRT